MITVIRAITDREDRPADEKSGHRYCALVSADEVQGIGLTVCPSRTFCIPSTMTRSPGLSPIFDHPKRTYPVAHVDRSISTLLSPPTTATS